MLFKVLPLSGSSMLDSSYLRADGGVLSGATGEPPLGGFTIIDSYNAHKSSAVDINTSFGGGYGTGVTGGFEDYAGPAWSTYSWYT